MTSRARLLAGGLLTAVLFLGAGSAAAPGVEQRASGPVPAPSVPCPVPPSTEPSIQLDEASTSAQVGDEHTVTGTVTGAPPGVVAVRVATALAVLDTLEVTVEGTRFSAPYRSDDVGTVQLEATLTLDGEVVDVARTTHTWVPRPTEPASGPVLRLEPVSSDGTVQQQHTVSLTIEQWDNRGDIEVVVVAGPHLGTQLFPLREFSSRYGYDGEEVGTDEIQATLTRDGVEYPSNVVTQVWQAPPGIELTPTGTTAEVGDRHQVQVRVTGTEERPQVQVVRGVNTGRPLEVSGEAGSYTASWTSEEPGTDYVVGSLTDAGVQSGVVEHTWTAAPVEEPSVDQEPGEDLGEDRGRVDDDQRVQDEDPPAVDDTDGADDTEPPVIIRRAVIPLEAVRSRTSGTVPGTPCLDASITPADGASQVGVERTFVVTVLDDEGDAVAGADVELRAELPGASEATYSASTDQDGVARVTHSRDSAGTEALTATAGVDGPAGRLTGDGATSHTWVTGQGIGVTVQPDGTVSPVGSTFTATVTVRDDDGEPVEGAAVDLTASMPDVADVADVPDEVREGTTDEQGRVSFGWSRAVAGSDTIEVVARHDGREAVASASHGWEDVPGLGVDLQPAGTTSLVGSDFTVTALVTLDGEPLEDAQVAFDATMVEVTEDEAAAGVAVDDVDVAEGSGATDPDGLASFGYTRAVAGEDVVTAVVTTGGLTGEAAVSHSWVSVPGLAVDIGPAGRADPVGADFTATVTVTLDGEPAEGATVALTRSMPGEDPVEEPVRTVDADGTTSTTWTRDVPGLELVQAEITVGDQSGPASMTHLWVDDPDDPDEPQDEDPLVVVTGGGGLAGAPVTVTGRGCPAQAEVDLALPEEPGLATTVAGADGSYEATVTIPDLAVGRYPLTAACPPVTATGSLDVVTTASTTGTAAASTVTTAMVLTFFVLLGGQLLRVSTFDGVG